MLFSGSLGIDFLIYVTERHFEEMLNFSPIDTVKRTIERTGKAIVTSALTMAGGFGALALSNFPANSRFWYLSVDFDIIQPDLSFDCSFRIPDDSRKVWS